MPTYDLIGDLNKEATQLLVKAKTDNLDVLLSTRLKPADTLAGISTVSTVTSITNPLGIKGSDGSTISSVSNPFPITGSVTQGTNPWVISGTLTGITNTVTTKEVRSATGSNSSVASTTTNSTSILASNANRLGATIYQDDTVSYLYISLGSTCTPTNFTIKIAPGGYYEVPFGYTGAITGVWSAATGSARITELT
jgi:hypothetical protein